MDIVDLESKYLVGCRAQREPCGGYLRREEN